MRRLKTGGNRLEEGLVDVLALQASVEGLLDLKDMKLYNELTLSLPSCSRARARKKARRKISYEGSLIIMSITRSLKRQWRQ